MTFKISDSVYWTGKIDWQLRKFHGDELSTHRGTSFNSYLIKDEKNVLIDTVWKPFTAEFLDNLRSLIKLEDIDYIVVNHGEPDHSGALPHLMAYLPDGVPIYCSKSGVASLKGHYHKDWNFKPVKTGDKLNIGSRELTFIEAPMLHWPDTMTTYLSDENILFSNDIFGQHYASEFMFDDKVNQYELYYEAMKYYANIIAPFAKKALKKVEELESLDLPINLIAPAHGVIWRKGIKNIIETYKKWSDAYKENQITIIYDTMYNSTRLMAESIADGIKQADDEAEIKIYNSSKTDKNDLITEIFKSKGICVGSPTLNGGVLSSVASIIEEAAGLNLRDKKAAVFGSYGWSPANIKVLTKALESAKFEVVGDGVKAQWKPEQKNLEECVEFGEEFAQSL